MSETTTERIEFGARPDRSLNMLAVLHGVGALTICAVVFFMSGEGASGMARIGVISFVIFLFVTFDVHALVFRSARGGDGVILDALGLGGGAAFKSPEKRVSWDRVREIERDERALVVTIAPKDMSSANPEDRRSKIRLAVEGTSAAELEAAIRKFWKVGEDA